MNTSRNERKWVSLTKSFLSNDPIEIIMDNAKTNLSFFCIIDQLSGFDPIGISKVQYEEEKHKFFIKINATLFDSTKVICFGRTYSSNNILIRSLKPLTFDSSFPHTLYFNTGLKKENLQILFECQLSLYENGQLINIIPIGTSKLNCNDSAGFRIIDLFQISSRNYFNMTNPGSNFKIGSVKYTLAESQVLKPLEELVPQNIIIGPNDIIPGFAGEKMSFKDLESINSKNIEILQPFQLYLSNFRINMPDFFEEKLKEKVLNREKESIKISEKSETFKNINIKIIERRMNVIPHNTLKYLSVRDKTSFIGLKKVSNSLLQSNGSLIVDNYYIHPLCSLVFLLEYQIRIEISETGIKQLKCLAGWQYFLPANSTEQLSKSLPCEKSLKYCEEIAPTGDFIYSPFEENSDKYDLNFSCVISSNPISNEINYIPDNTKLNFLESQLKATNALVDEQNLILKQSGFQVQASFKDLIDQEKSKIAIDAEKDRVTFGNTYQQIQFDPNQPPIIEGENLNIPKNNESYILKGEGDSMYLNKKEPEQDNSEALFLNRQIPMTDMNFLVNSGFLGSNESGLEEREINLELEKRDPFIAAQIIFEFLSYKLTSSPISWPEKLFFCFHFYNSQIFITESVRLIGVEQSKGNIGVLYGLEKSGPVSLTNIIESAKENKKTLYVEYVYNPVITNYDNEHELFLRYMSCKHMRIDLWNAENMFLLGYCRIKLSDILRQGKPTHFINREYDVHDYHNGEKIGSLQLKIINKGRNYENQFNYTDTENQRIVLKKGKAKVKVKSKPMNIDQSQINEIIKYCNQNPDKYKDTEDTRKKLRIERFKMSQVESINNSSSIAKSFTESRKLKEIEIIRELRKPLIIQNVLKSYSQGKTFVPFKMGDPSFVSFRFINEYEHSDSFKVKIIDPENSNDFKLIRKPEEWAVVCSQLNLERPDNFAMIDEQGSFILKPKEKINLIFKMLTFRTIKEMGLFIDKSHTKNKKQIAPSGQRTIQILIYDSKGNIIHSNEYCFVPRPCIIDCFYRYSKPEGKIGTIQISPDPHYGMTSSNYLVTDYKSASIKWEGQNSILLQVMIPPAPEITELFGFCYEDSFYSLIRSIFKVEIFSYKGISLNLLAGEYSTQKLNIFSNIVRNVRIYIEKPCLVSVHDNYSEQFSIGKELNTNIQIMVRNLKIEKEEIKVHCVDMNTKEVIHAWLISLETSFPKLIKNFKTTCIKGESNPGSFEYTNKSSSIKEFEFLSTNENLIKFKNKKIEFKENETKQIQYEIQAINEKGNSEEIIYVYDLSTYISEAILLKIYYTSK